MSLLCRTSSGRLARTGLLFTVLLVAFGGVSLVATPAAQAATLKTVDQFVSAYNGHYVDVDGFPSDNPYQCTDLFNLYHEKVVGGSYVRMSISGGAKDLWSTSNNSQVNSDYVRISKSSAVRKGDVAVWGGYSSGYQYSDYGHVAIVLANGSAGASSLSTLTQNPGATQKTSLSKTGLLGYLRPKRFALFNTAAPSVSGTAKVGSKLTAKNGSWSVSGVTYKYQWYASGSAVSGATSSTFTPSASVYGKKIQVKVTASKSGYGSVAATSASTGAVAAGTMTNSAVPVVSGTPVVGGTLTASSGAWSPTPSATTSQWYADGVAIPGATGTSLVLTADQLGAVITLTQKATKTGYSTSTSTSAPTAPVAAGTLSKKKAPSLRGRLKVGATLTAKPGAWSPGPVTVTYRWAVGGKSVGGAHTTKIKIKASMRGKKVVVHVRIAKAGYTTRVIVLHGHGKVAR